MSVSTKIKSFSKLFIQAVKGDENQVYTTGSIDKAIFLLAVPMILEMSMEALFAVVDAFYVSRLDDNAALTTVGLTESVLTLIYSIGMGLSMGATAMVARRVGEKDVAAARDAAAQVIYIGLAFSFVITIIGLFFAEEILRVMGGSEELIAANVGYTRWMIGGNITIMLLFLINGIFRGAGDAALSMRTLIVSNALNIALGPIFIFVLDFGVVGAAIATNIGRGSAVIYQVYHLFKGKGVIRLHVENLKVRLDLIWRLIKVSAGGAGQFLIASASWIFLVRILNVPGPEGEIAVAGYTVAIRVVIFTILPAWGLANAAATLVGQNLGAGQPDRAEKSVWRSAFLNLIFLASVMVIFLSLAKPIMGIFTEDPLVIKGGVQCLQIVSLGYIFYAYGMVISQSFNGAGDTRTPTLINVFGFWCLQIPLAYTLAIILDWGSPGVYAAISIAESSIAVVGILIFRRGKWKEAQI
ncbi:MATE family efflux transporter [Pseudochryseolinea flava]|uniref:Multidrug-efflux transporter n=1 Tax=Pseudochryseolinea flava TaxID=2059302 RepID=A0A364XUF9_9BACT|nr:MATE family efflux transporter [Pseudochryseolinea flava]RAV97890.1 MATE family efflux transporter [Pseudochryseolinea flava]